MTYYPFGPVASITYGNGRDMLGNLTQFANAAGTAGNKFLYDALNRLTNVNEMSNALVAACTYDGTGNA